MKQLEQIVYQKFINSLFTLNTMKTNIVGLF